MRYPKPLMITFCLLLFVFIGSQGYSFFRDDMDHERIIRRVEEKRQESRDRLKENQEKKKLKQKEKVKAREPIPKKVKAIEKVPVQPKPKIGVIVFLILCLGLGWYLFCRRKE